MNEEDFVAMLDTYNLLKDIKDKKDADLIEIEVGYIRQPIVYYLLTIIDSNKDYLNHFCNFLEKTVKTTDDEKDLRKINEFLELKPFIKSFFIKDVDEKREGLEAVLNDL